MLHEFRSLFLLKSETKDKQSKKASFGTMNLQVTMVDWFRPH